MKRLILLGSTVILLAGCTVVPDADYLEPGTVAEIVPWQPRWSTRRTEEAALFQEPGILVNLKPGTKVVVLRQAKPVENRYHYKVARTVVRVLDGPHQGVEGNLPRAHLWDTGKTVEIEQPKQEPPTPRSTSS